MRMILAQALGEYGLVSALRDAVLLARIRIEDTLRQAEPVHYGIAVLAVVMLWVFLGRRS
jgi:hypothetical protein